MEVERHAVVSSVVVLLCDTAKGMYMEALKIGAVLVHGLFQFPERQGISFMGLTPDGDKCYEVPADVFLKGYSAAQCSCGDLEIPAGTFLKRRRYGDGYSFGSMQVIDDPRKNEGV